VKGITEYDDFQLEMDGKILQIDYQLNVLKVWNMAFFKVF